MGRGDRGTAGSTVFHDIKPQSHCAHVGFVTMGSEASLFPPFTAVTYTLGTVMRSGDSENRLWGKVLKLGCYTRGNGVS